MQVRHMYCLCSTQDILTLFQCDKTCIILLWLTPDAFIRQRESSICERVNNDINAMYVGDMGAWRYLWLDRLTGHQKVAGWMPVWDSEIVFLK